MKRYKPIEVQRLQDKLNADLVQIQTKNVQLNGKQTSVLLVRADNSLLCYTYNPGTKLWQYLWNSSAFFNGTDDLRKQPWLISADGFVVARTDTGLHVFKFDDKFELKHLATDGRYHAAYGWDQPDHVMLIGHFYNDPSKIGIMSRNDEGTIFFEAVIKEEALKRAQTPVWRIENDPAVPATWKNLETDITLAYVDSTEQQAFVVKDVKELSVFKFDKTHLIRKTVAAPRLTNSSRDSDMVVFGKLSAEDRLVNNVLHFNETGLTEYRYVSTSGDLQPILYAGQFAGKLGWNHEHVGSVILDDVDGDGMDEMLFCGPSGFNVIKVSEEEVLEDIIVSEKDFDVPYRHLKAFVVPNLTQDQQQIVAVNGNGIIAYKLNSYSESSSNVNGVLKLESVNEITNSHLPLLSESMAFLKILNVHDQLDFADFLHPRNPLLGTLDFSVPLIEIPNPFGISISHSIKYKEYGAPDVLGHGWSLPVDCIYIDRQGSIFSIDHNYYLVKNGLQSHLNPKLDTTVPGILSFTLQGSPELEIKYYKSQNLWEIKTKLEKYSYGRLQNVDWLQWESGSEEWPMTQNTTAPVKAKPFAWFLAKREDQLGNHLKYVYSPVYGKLSNGNPFVQKLSLLKVISSNGDSLRFTYDSTNKLLKNYVARTETYHQNVSFEYTDANGTAYLTSISQSSVPILKFKYAGPKHEMTEIVYPNGLVSRFSYSSYKFQSALTENRFEFRLNGQLTYGPDYMLIGDKTENGQVRIKARDVVGSATTAMSGLVFPALGKEPVVSFEMFALERFFAVSLTHENHKEMCIFRQTSSGWSTEASYMRLAKDSTMQTGKSFILVRSGKRLAVLQYNGNRWDVKPVLNNLDHDDIVRAFSHAFIMYNDTGLKIGFQSESGEWITRQVPIGSNLIRSSLLVLEQFESDRKTHDDLKKIFTDGVLNVYHNAIVIRSLSLEGRKLYLRLHCKIFNNSHELINDETMSVLVEDLDEYVLELPPIDENYFKIGYELSVDKFKVKVKDHSGKIIDEVNRIKEKVEEEIRKHPRASEAEKNKFRKDSHDKLTNELNEIYKNVTASIPFAIDPAKLSVHVNNDNIVAASHKFHFDGSRWSNEKIPQSEINMADFSIQLGNTFYLTKSGKNDTFKLHDASSNNKLIWNSNTNNGNDIFLSFPTFIGVQNNQSAEIYTFGNRKVHRLPEGEFLSRLSNPSAIITVTENEKSVIVRSMKSFTNYRQSVITKQQLLHNENDIRMTIFEYDPSKVKPFSDGFAFSKSKTLPDGKPQTYGWFEDNFNLMDMGNSTKTVHNSQGVVVKTIKAEEDEKPRSFDNDGILTDRFERFEIVDFRPYRISQELVSYYGFEPYESNRIGTDSSWIFDSSMLTNEHSNYFLRLKSGSSIKGHFEPQLHGLAYVFSCWIRTTETTLIPEAIRLRGVDRNGQLISIENGTIRADIGEWKYVEVHYKSASGDLGNKIEVDIRNLATANIDVDHLRMTPLDFNFQANLLDYRSGKTRAVLKNSGLIEQKLYDASGREICTISDDGTIEVFITASKNCALWKNGQWISRAEMRPLRSEIGTVSGNGSMRKSFNYIHNSFGFRFLYKLSGTGKIATSLRRLSLVISREADQTKLKVNNSQFSLIDHEGEITMLLLPTRISVWVQGHLIEDKQVAASAQKWSIDITPSGQGHISEILYMYDPSVTVYYMNKLGLAIQEIVLKNQDTINVRQIMYDAIDRPVLKTKWISIQPGAKSFFNYNPKIIINTDDILTSHKAEGLANEMNLDCMGYPFTWTSYQYNPLETEAATGLPGKEFSVQGQFATKFGTHHNFTALNILFPLKMGYTHEFEQNASASQVVQVFDKSKNKVAELVKVVNYDHRLTTFEYDDQNRLLCTLPPAYHYKAKTLSRTGPFESLRFTAEENTMRIRWGKFYKYDQNGRLIEKVTPDSGKQEFIYSHEGLLQFLVQGDGSTTQSTTYYAYGNDGKIIERGIVDVPTNNIHKYLSGNATLPKSDNYVAFDYGATELLPAHRNLMQMSLKVSNNVTVTEALLFDPKQKLLNQIFVSSKNSLSFNYQYQNNKIKEIEYPFFVGGLQLKLSYTYHIDQNIRAVRIGNQTIAIMDYTPSGSIQTIQFEPQTQFTYKRSFGYNQPGYLTSVKDKFLTELIDYTTKSYGGQSFGDGTVSSTLFNATWHEYSDISRIKLKWKSFSSNETTNEYAQLCFENLKKLDYFDERNRPIKSFYPLNELQLPLICNTGSRANHIASVLVTKGFPSVYGHRYDYENHKQLIKAKYFQNLGERNLEPLSQLTFSNHIRSINDIKSRNIWNALKSAGFIITDCSNSEACHAVLGKPLLHPAIATHINGASLEILLINGIKSRKDIPQQIFIAVCETWHQHDPMNRQQLCATVWKEMLANSFVGSRSEKSMKAVNSELKMALKAYTRNIGDIVGVLYDHFKHALGNSAGDVQSYNIDPNGNHVHFYTGFKRYRLECMENTNKVSKVFATDLTAEDLSETEFAMDHDSEGNVIKAMHKSISKIVYDPLLKRPTEITMTDGRRLIFQYDVRGERLFKQVIDQTRQITKEKYYMRDVTGRCLVDYEVTYLQGGRDPHVRSTAYIYAGDVLVGFVRNDQFYSVFVDHEGSIRLVVKNGEVVAAYDYLPYGQLLRKYNGDLDGSIVYLYTGQEWDEETGLFNFHARLYDPEIGRFYQIDPKEQYPSPYVYAGNSPISLIDPDGQFAFLVAIAFAAVGSYLGASAANNSFNPLKWKLAPTLVGGVLGGIAGGLAPAAIGASFTFLTATVGLSAAAAGGVLATTSIGFAYLSGASVNNNWNPIDWKWSSPGTWNSLFSGGLTGATLFGGMGKVHERFISLVGFTDKLAFVGVVASGTVGIAFFAGSAANNWSVSFWEWDWKNPSTIWKVTMGASFGMSVSPDLHKIQNQVAQKMKDFKTLIGKVNSGNIEKILSEAKIHFKESSELFQLIKTTFKDLSKQVLRPQGAGVAQIIATGKRGSSNKVISTIKSVLFEAAKFGLQANLSGVIETLDDVNRLDNRENLRRKRDTSCCELQLLTHDTIVDHRKLLTSDGTLQFSILNELFYNFFAYFKTWNYRTPHSDRQPTELGSKRTLPKAPKTFTVHNCYRFATSDNSIHIQCFGSKSNYDIFPKLNHQLTIEDFYSNCSPVEYDGHSSVFCHGESSNLLFTPKIFANGLDVFNGWLMLALVTPNALRSIHQTAQGLFNNLFRSRENDHPKGQSSSNINMLKGKLFEIENKFDLAKLTDMRWLTHIWEDLVVDVEKLSTGSGMSSHEELIDRIDALEEELIEVSYFVNDNGNTALNTHLCKTEECRAQWEEISTGNIGIIYSMNQGFHQLKNIA